MANYKCMVCGKPAYEEATFTFPNGECVVEHFCEEHISAIKLMQLCLEYNVPINRIIDFYLSMDNMVKEERETLEDMKLCGEDYVTDEMCMRALDKLVELMCSNEEILVPTFRAWLGVKEN